MIIINIKKTLKYLLCLLPWFISGLLFKIDKNYYKSLILPFFASSTIISPIIWTILYILISISIYKTIERKTTTNYKIYLFINYFSNQFFTLCFFIIKNNFLAFSDSLIVFISSLYLYVETKNLNKKAAFYLVPYIVWNLFATILSITIFFLN